MKTQLTTAQLALCFEEAIELLTDAQRIELRKSLESQGITEFPRNLFYNYKTQKWITE